MAAIERSDLERVAELVHKRNKIDQKIHSIVRRAVVHGHLGEYIAGGVFDLAINDNASTPGVDGVFLSGELAGATVNVKWYGRREGILDLTTANRPQYYLVMTGPTGVGARGGLRPLVIDAVYLFNASRLFEQQRSRGVKIGVASSVPKGLWEAAQVYPVNRTGLDVLPADGERLLRLFASPEADGSSQGG